MLFISDNSIVQTLSGNHAYPKMLHLVRLVT